MRLRDISCNTICNRTEIWKNRSLNFSETDDNDIDKQQMATMPIVSRSKRMRLRHLFGPYSHNTSRIVRPENERNDQIHDLSQVSSHFRNEIISLAAPYDDALHAGNDQSQKYNNKV